jgi:hypothetical protein
MTIRHICIGLGLFAVPATAVRAQSVPPEPVTSSPVARAVRTSVAPVVDGRLDEGVWALAPVLDGFTQFEPFDGRPVSERTEVRILFDDRALYIGAWLYDSDPSGIVRGEARRDINLSEVDAFLVVLDTYRDRQNAFVFGTSPLGVEYDGQVTREGQGGFGGAMLQRNQAGSGGGFNLNWDGEWSVATSSDEQGWYAEFRIPFSTLRYRGGAPQVWGLNLARHIRRRNEQAFWSPVPRQYSLYRLSLAGTLEGIEPPVRRVGSVTPYTLGSVRRDYADPRADSRIELGADAKIGVTSSLMLDLTVNTDFAQVEVDDQQANLTRFSLFFPEKRPFFLENAGSFAVGTPQTTELFFSRRIGIGPDRREVPLLGGARLTGRAGGWSVGLLDIQAQRRDAIAPNNFGVVRVFRELPNRSRLGAIAVSRLNTDSTADYNLTYGLDGQVGLGEKILVEGYAAGTRTPGRDGPAWAAHASVTYTGRDWELGAAYRTITEDFNPEVGFLSRTNTRFVSVRALRHLRTPGVEWFREFRPHVTVRQHMDHDGFITTRLVHIDNHFAFANGAFFQLPAINFTREGLREPFEIHPGVVIPPGTYDNFNWGFIYNTDRSAPLSLSGRIDLGGFYSGTRRGVGATLATRQGGFAGEARVSWDDVRLPEGDLSTLVTGVRLAWSFTPRIYVQSLIQYSNQAEQFSGNVRFGLLSSAGTGLFVVLNAQERTGAGRGPVERAVIVKYTQLFGL